MTREPQKKTTDDYRSAWDRIFGQKPADKAAKEPPAAK